MDNSSIVSASTFNPYPFAIPNENRTIDSNTLFTNGDVIFIQHQGEQYSLRRTRNGKLILTK
jgi:hemin uptake protein HemP